MKEVIRKKCICDEMFHTTHTNEAACGEQTPSNKTEYELDAECEVTDQRDYVKLNYPEEPEDFPWFCCEAEQMESVS